MVQNANKKRAKRPKTLETTNTEQDRLNITIIIDDNSRRAAAAGRENHG